MTLITRIGWSAGLLGALVLGAGCGDDSGGKAKQDAGGQVLTDAAVDSGAGQGVACGKITCKVSDADLAWGAEACCVDAVKDVCGVKSEHPVVMTPDGGTVSVGEALIALLSVVGDAGVVNKMPTLACVPKNAPGKLSKSCPTEIIDLTAALMSDGGADDSGVQTLEVPGCCREDGACGYMDQATGLGCLKISQSFIGQVLGRQDQSCN